MVFGNILFSEGTFHRFPCFLFLSGVNKTKLKEVLINGYEMPIISRALDLNIDR